MTKNAIPESLFGAMRICLMNEDELYFYTASSDVSSVRNELLVYSTLLDLLKTRLQRINRSTNEVRKFDWFAVKRFKIDYFLIRKMKICLKIWICRTERELQFNTDWNKDRFCKMRRG